LNLPPGENELRMAVRDNRTGATGTLSAPLVRVMHPASSKPGRQFRQDPQFGGLFFGRLRRILIAGTVV